VQAQYNTDVNFIASQALARGQAKAGGGGGGGGAGSGSDEEVGSERGDAMAALEREVRAPAGFVAAKDGGGIKGSIRNVAATASAEVNPDAIDLDMDG